MNDLKEISDPINNSDLKNKNIFETHATPAVERLEQLTDSQFENFILEWAFGYHRPRYPGGAYKVAGPGDKGRDIVCFESHPQTPGAIWDNYQCKYYKDKLQPSDIWEEVGKVVYHTFHKEFSIPRKYYFVSHKGIGPKLFDYLNNPASLKTEFIKNWNNNWATLNQKSDIFLTGDLKTYVETFDYSIFFHKAPAELIEQHAQTNYFALRFGGGAKVNRPEPKLPSDAVSSAEASLTYIKKLLAAYSEYKNEEITRVEALERFADLLRNFKEQRISFYFAEQLKQFGKETYPPDAQYHELTEQIYSGIMETLDMDFDNGFERLLAVLTQATNIQIDSHILKDLLKVRDRKGICHQLANDDRISWIKK